jgi:hypothetical protein
VCQAVAQFRERATEWVLVNPFQAQSENPAVTYMAAADVPKEALFFLTAAEALKRGLALLVFDRPGQGEILRLQNVPIMLRAAKGHPLPCAISGTSFRTAPGAIAMTM